MSWIRTIPYDESEGPLRKAYNRIKGPENYIDNIMLVHSLRPHTLDGHMRLYKNVLHHSGNTVSKAVLETLGVYVSLLNGCAYCVEHHYQGLRRLVDDDDRSGNIRAALESGNLSAAFDSKEQAMLAYTRKLTTRPADMVRSDFEALKAVGLSDAEVLEINQVVAYFAYANRTVQGLGCSTDGDVLGTSPNDSDDPDNWQHA